MITPAPRPSVSSRDLYSATGLNLPIPDVSGFIGPISMGLQSLSALTSYQADKKQAKYQQAMAEYNNTMTALSDAASQNAITGNEILAMEASAAVAEDIQLNELDAQGAAAVNAAVSGVAGRSVATQVFDIKRSANVAEGQRVQDLSNQFLAFDQQRRTSALSSKMQQTSPYIPKPSLSKALMGMVAPWTDYFSKDTPQVKE